MDDDFEQLRGILESSDAETRGMAAIALGQVASPQTVDLLVELLDDEDQRVVCAAVQSLGAQGDRRATPALLGLMQSDDVEIKRSVLSALAQVADERAFPAVVTALFDVDDQVRRNAAAAIGRLGDKRALEPLYEMLSDSFNWVRANAALSLLALADPRSAKPLSDRLAVEDDEMVRGNLVLALSACDPTSIPHVIELLLDEGEACKVRVSAAMALARLSEDGALAEEGRAREVLVSLLGSPQTDEEVRAACAWALGRLPHHGSSVDVLCAALEDPYRWVVLYAVESIALLKDPRAIPALERARRRYASEGGASGDATSGDDDADDVAAQVVEHIDDALRELADALAPHDSHNA